MGRRAWLAGLAVAALAAGGYFSTRAPRITLLNASLVIDYPWPRAAAALVCAVALGTLAALQTRPVLRRIGLVLALGPLLVAGHLFRYRLEAGGSALVSRSLIGATTIAWREMRGVELGATSVLLRGGEDQRSIRIDTSDFAPEQRAIVERTLARHVREQGGTGIVTVP